MARSFDNRRFPAGPIYGPDGKLIMRGPRRKVVGRVTPGDDVEVSREIERLWEWHMRLERMLSEIKRRLRNSDDGSAGSEFNFEDFDSYVPADTDPPTGLASNPADVTATTGSAVASASGGLALERYKYYYNNGWRTMVRLIGQIDNGSGSIGVSSDLDGHSQLLNYTSDAPVAGPITFDTGWVLIDKGTLTADEEDTATYYASITNGAYGSSTTLQGLSLYVQWVPDGFDDADVIVNNGVSDVAGIEYHKLAMNPTSIAFADSPYTLTTLVDLLLVNATGGAVTVNLPYYSNLEGRVWTVKKTDASGNAVTITDYATETIDGAGTYVLAAQYDAVTFVCDGSTWHVVSSYP